MHINPQAFRISLPFALFYEERGMNSWALVVIGTSSKTIWQIGLEETQYISEMLF